MVNTDPIIKLSNFLSGAGIEAIVALFLIIIGGLVWERIRLIKKNNENQQVILENKDKELDSVKKIIDRYHEGNLNLSRTLSEIKIVLESIQRK